MLTKNRPKNLLITGGAGFIGSNFIDFYLKSNKTVKIYNLDKLTYAGSLENTNEFKENERYKFVQGDICDLRLLEKIFNKYKIDGVINFAAESHVDNSILNPTPFISTNINGVFKLLLVCYKFWMKCPFVSKKGYEDSRFHQISTDEVYGSIEKGNFLETDKYMPNSPYSASKASADMIVRSFNKTYGLNTTISISSNNYGKNQNSEKFIPKVIECIKKNIEIPVYGDGNNIRDWIDVDDNCRAIKLIFECANEGEIFNVGSGNEYSNLNLISIINEIMNGNSDRAKVLFVKDRYGHDFRYSLNCDKIKTELNWSPKKNFKNSIKKYVIIKT